MDPIMDERHLWWSAWSHHALHLDPNHTSANLRHVYPYCNAKMAEHVPSSSTPWLLEKRKCHLHYSSTLARFLNSLAYSPCLKKISHAGQKVWICVCVSENPYCCASGHVSLSTSLASVTTGGLQGAPEIEQLVLPMACLELDTVQAVSSPSPPVLWPQAPQKGQTNESLPGEWLHP